MGFIQIDISDDDEGLSVCLSCDDVAKLRDFLNGILSEN